MVAIKNVLIWLVRAYFADRLASSSFFNAVSVKVLFLWDDWLISLSISMALNFKPQNEFLVDFKIILISLVLPVSTKICRYMHIDSTTSNGPAGVKPYIVIIWFYMLDN